MTEYKSVCLRTNRRFHLLGGKCDASRDGWNAVGCVDGAASDETRKCNISQKCLP